MDYKNYLIEYLSSDKNINDLVDLVMKNLKIKASSIPACKKVIAGNVVINIENLDVNPTTSAEVAEIIGIFNKQCYDNFCDYLMKRQPGKDIFKFNNQNKIPQIIKSNDNEMIILSENEKNKLLEQYGISENATGEGSSVVPVITQDIFLEYLTNPTVLEMFKLMIDQMNQFNPQNDNINPNQNIKVDVVLTEEEVYNLLQVKTQKKKSAKQIVVEESESDESNESNESDSVESDSIHSISESEEDDGFDCGTRIDLLHGINNENLILIEKRIKEITDLKNLFLSKRNKSNDKIIEEKISQLDSEKKELVIAILDYQKKCKKMSKNNKNKINKISDQIESQSDPNVEILALEINPMDDYNDLKNILIKIKTDKKISEIMLVDYFLPFNGNNINRFNNVFSIYMSEQTFKVIVPPSNYGIQPLLNYIKSQLTFLDFNINNNIITITNTANMTFDLVINDDSILTLLGFTNKANNYRGKNSYTSSVKYDLETNMKAYFCLSGTSMEPLLMEFDKNIEINHVLKKARSGFMLRQLVLRFTNSLEQFYDFILPIKIKLKITYMDK